MVIRRPLRTLVLGLACWGCAGLSGIGGGAAWAQNPFVRGDCNGDGDRGALCDVSDAIYALNYLFLSGEIPGCFEACNVNDDSNFNIADPIYHLGACFGFGNRIPPPFPECGRDPTPSLSCDEFERPPSLPRRRGACRRDTVCTRPTAGVGSEIRVRD